VFAWDGDTVAGHATLVPDDDAHELAIFVDQAYQGAGVGTALIRALLGHGARVGIERVWLTVERWNRAAVALYEKVGFETASAESFELEMAARLADPDADQNGGGGGDTVGGADTADEMDVADGADTASETDTPEESSTTGDPDAVESDVDAEPVASDDESDEPDGNDTDGDFVTTTRGDPDSNADLDTETGSDTE